MLGLRVELTGVFENRDLNGFFGTIVAIERFRDGEFSYLVAVENWHRGHNGRRTVVPSHLEYLIEADNCWWVSIINIKCVARRTSENPVVTKQEAIINKIKSLDKKFKERKLK